VKTIVFLGDLQSILEEMPVHAQGHIAIDLDEAPIGIPGKTRVARSLCQPQHGRIVQTQIEHRIHHARHGHARPTAPTPAAD
jgi:hypothetical protein